jgi:hypothetical protein
MADKYQWTRTKGNRRYRAIYEPPFYDSTNRADTGNYNSLGQFVGSMRSISAPAWESEIGHPPSAQEMQAITATQAENIMFEKYWNKVQGDKIINQKVAELIADVKSSIGNSKLLQKALNQPETGTVTDANIAELNKQLTSNAQDFYNRYRAVLVNYYQGVSNGDHVARLNRDYPANLDIGANETFWSKHKIAIVSIGVGVCALIIWKTT